MKALVIAGTGSGVGKTTVTAALLAALKRRGLRVQAFKCGPDFIDPGHHTRICGRPSHNLDTWMLSADQNRRIFASGCRGADIAVVEGMMGAFDGVQGASEAGSTAEIAKLLGLSVLLVVDASSAARSAAATVYGFQNFDPCLNLSGVIFNRVANHHHARMLLDAMRSRSQSLAAGWLLQDSALSLPERHLGLQVAEERTWTNGQLESLATSLQQNFPLDQILERCENHLPQEIEHPADLIPEANDRVRIGIARDQAFCFYYEAALEELRRQGAELVEFSPLKNSHLPEQLDAVYLGGGYPELYPETLSRNQTLISDLQQFAAEERPIYGECGGLMFLSRELRTLDGKSWPMAGLLPLSVHMTERPVHFGYADLEFLADGLAGKGTFVRGHSFHYSTIVEGQSSSARAVAHYTLSGENHPEGFTAGTVFGSYIHLHFASAPELARRFVLIAKARQQREVAR